MTYANGQDDERTSDLIATVGSPRAHGARSRLRLRIRLGRDGQSQTGMAKRGELSRALGQDPLSVRGEAGRRCSRPRTGPSGGRSGTMMNVSRANIKDPSCRRR